MPHESREQLIAQQVEQNIEKISRIIDAVVFELKKRYSEMEKCHVTREELKSRCAAKAFTVHHQEWGLDEISRQIVERDVVPKAAEQLEKAINQGLSEKDKITIGIRIEHAGIRNSKEGNWNNTLVTNAFVSNPNSDLLLHINPIEGGGNFTTAVYERLVKLESNILSEFAPDACVTATLISPNNPAFPHASALYHFAQKELIRAFFRGGKYSTSFGGGVEEGYFHMPARREIKPEAEQIKAFLADYHFHSGAVVGKLQDFLQNLGIQKGFTINTERGPIASSANVEGQMVLHQDKVHLYFDARTILSSAVPKGYLPPNRKWALQLITNVLADLATARGAGLEVYFILPTDNEEDTNKLQLRKEEWGMIKIDTAKAAYSGKEVLIVNDPEEIRKYFSQFDMRNPFVNPAISVLIGFPELFDKSSRFYLLGGIGHAIEDVRKHWRSETKELSLHNYRIPGYILTEPLSRRGSRKVVFRAVKEGTCPAQEKVIKIFDLMARVQEANGKTVDDLANMDGVITTLKGVPEKTRQHISCAELKGQDGKKIAGKAGKEENVTYLVYEPYSCDLDEMYPLGTKVPLKQIFEYGEQILGAVSFLHEHGLVHLDIKYANIGIKDNNIVLDDLEQCHSKKGEIASPTVCSIDTRPKEIHEIKHKEKIPVDPRIDIFQLGANFYRMATGWWPFSPQRKKPVEGGADRDAYEKETKEQVCSGNYSAAFSKLRDIPSDMAEAITTALQMEQKARYKDAQEMLTAFSKIKARHELFEKTTNIMEHAKNDPELSEHTAFAEKMLTELHPDASYAEKMAVRCHDIERGVGLRVEWDKGRESYASYKKRHAKRSKEMAGTLLSSFTDTEFTKQVLFLIEHHDHQTAEEAVPEVSSGYELRLRSSLQRVMDADSLTFFLKDFSRYTERGDDEARTKVRFMFDKMSHEARKKLDQSGILQNALEYHTSKPAKTTTPEPFT